MIVAPLGSAFEVEAECASVRLKSLKLDVSVRLGRRFRSSRCWCWPLNLRRGWRERQRHTSLRNRLVRSIPDSTTHRLGPGHLFLQQGQGASSIKSFGALNNDDSFDFRFETVNETLSEIQWVIGWGVGLELIHQFRESRNIGRDSGCLINVKELAKQ